MSSWRVASWFVVGSVLLACGASNKAQLEGGAFTASAVDAESDRTRSDGAGSDRGVADNPRARVACDKSCAVAASLGCSNQPTDCVARCLNSMEQIAQLCPTEGLAFVECLASRDAADFVCDGAGRSAPKDGVCKEEQEAVKRCVLPR